MTAELWELRAKPLDVVESTVLSEIARAGRRYAIEALGTFCVLSTVGVVLCTANPFAAVAVGAALFLMVYAGGHRAGVHCNPAITLAALLRHWIPMRDAAGYWCAQLVAGMWAAIAWRVIVSPARIEAATAMMLSGRTLVAALAAELSFTFVLSYVVFRCIDNTGHPPNTLVDFAIGVSVVVGNVDLTALFGVVSLVSQIITGALAGVAFLTFGQRR
jgi:aquaporin Z